MSNADYPTSKTSGQPTPNISGATVYRSSSAVHGQGHTRGQHSSNTVTNSSSRSPVQCAASKREVLLAGAAGACTAASPALAEVQQPPEITSKVRANCSEPTTPAQPIAARQHHQHSPFQRQYPAISPLSLRREPWTCNAARREPWTCNGRALFKRGVPNNSSVSHIATLVCGQQRCKR